MTFAAAEAAVFWVFYGTTEVRIIPLTQIAIRVNLCWMIHLARFRADFTGDSAFSLSTCFFKALCNFGWKTCAANSSLVISIGCFLLFFGMVTL